MFMDRKAQSGQDVTSLQLELQIPAVLPQIPGRLGRKLQSSRRSGRAPAGSSQCTAHSPGQGPHPEPRVHDKADSVLTHWPRHPVTVVGVNMANRSLN